MRGGRRRMERVNHALREELSRLIQRELKDPRVAGLVSVTDVETASDLSQAKVYVSVLGEPEERAETLKTLAHAAGFFRSMLAERMSTRTVPQLDFRLDDSLERGDRILRLMREAESP